MKFQTLAFLKPKLFLLLIILLGAFFRFYDINWDQDQHLHPDERFLTMVGTAMKIPVSFAEYLNPKASPMNPANINFPFFVYGTLPIVLNKFLAIQLHLDTYTNFTLAGRAVSGFFDVLIIAFVYKIMQLFEKEYHLNKEIKLLAAFFYAIAVLPIQLSHFFAVDTFLTCFMMASLYFSLRFYYQKELENILFCAVMLGLAIATKVTAIFILPLLGYFITIGFFKRKTKHIILSFLGLIIFCGITVYLTTRLADPYLFQDASIFHIAISKEFLQNLSQLKSWENADFPPAVQWVHKPPVIFALINLGIFGLGLPYFLFTIIGMFRIWKMPRLWRDPDWKLPTGENAKWKIFKPLPIITLWTVAFFLYQSMQFVKAMRYFIFLYPLLACYAAIGLSFLLNNPAIQQLNNRNHYIKHILFIVSLIAVLFWPLSYFSIYTKPHSRITASEWIYANIPSGSNLLSEYWDDALPVGLPNVPGSQYRITELHIFDGDTPEKWMTMNQTLAEGNYYILSSNRGWGSIPTVPEKYPQMKQFYTDLFAGKTNYKKIAQFTSYPSLSYLGIPISIPDQWADETFTVYDHPKVMIFKNTDNNF